MYCLVNKEAIKRQKDIRMGKSVKLPYLAQCLIHLLFICDG